MPRDPGSDKDRQPQAKEIKACKDRLVEIYEICNPSVIVAVGALSAKWIPKLLDVEFDIQILHPAAILKNRAQRGLSMQKNIVRLEQVFQELE